MPASADMSDMGEMIMTLSEDVRTFSIIENLVLELHCFDHFVTIQRNITRKIGVAITVGC